MSKQPIRMTGAQRMVLISYTVDKAREALNEDEPNRVQAYLDDINQICTSYLNGSDPRSGGSGY